MSDNENDIREMVNLSGAVDSINLMITKIFGPIQDSMPLMYQSAVKEAVSALKAEDIVDSLVDIYAQLYTPEEVRATLAFYRTPEYQSIRRKTPEVVAMTEELTQVWVNSVFNRTLEPLGLGHLFPGKSSAH